MAGARLGFGAACKELIADLNAIKYATNPYNVNGMTMAAGIGALEDEEYTRANCRAVMETREDVTAALREMGFELGDSKANFVFPRHPKIDGHKLYEELRARGILVRHFDTPLLARHNRITIGSREQMNRLLDTLGTILEEC